MIISRIKDLVPKVAQALNLPDEVVAHVVAHCFQYIKTFLQYPNRAGIRIPYLGVLRTSSFRLRHYLSNHIIPAYKKNKITKDRLKAYWNLRKLVREDEQRRDYKTRFNLKFNPHWRQNSNSVEGD